MSGQGDSMTSRWKTPAIAIGVLAIGAVGGLVVFGRPAPPADDVVSVANSSNPREVPMSEEELFFQFGTDDVEEFEPYPWTARERTDFVINSAVDIHESQQSVFYDDGRYVGFGDGEGDTISTSPDGIEWTAQPTVGREAFDDWRSLAVGDGTVATITVDWDTSQAFYATSTDLTNWSTHELDLPEDARTGIYPIDVAVYRDRIAVLIGVDIPSHGNLVLSGVIGEELSVTELPANGMATSVESVGGAFALGVQMPGETVPVTVVWTSTDGAAWQTAAPLPDNLTGSLHVVGESLVVVGISYADVEVFTAVSTDGGASWVRGEVDPTIHDVIDGPGGLVGRADSGWIFSRDGITWTPLAVLVAGGSGEEGIYRELWNVAVGIDEAIVNKFEADLDAEDVDDVTSTNYAVPLPD